jgi:hypothetical protein
MGLYSRPFGSVTAPPLPDGAAPAAVDTDRLPVKEGSISSLRKRQVLRTRRPTGLDRATLTDRWCGVKQCVREAAPRESIVAAPRDKASARRRRANPRLPEQLPIGIT